MVGLRFVLGVITHELFIAPTLTRGYDEDLNISALKRRGLSIMGIERGNANEWETIHFTTLGDRAVATMQMDSSVPLD